MQDNLAAPPAFRAIAIYRSPPGAPKRIAVREERIDPASRVPDWKGDPKFFDDLTAARGSVPAGYRHSLPMARDRRDLPLLLEVWLGRPERALADRSASAAVPVLPPAKRATRGKRRRESVSRRRLPIPMKTVRRIAAQAEVAERTAIRVLLGIRTRPDSRERVAEALNGRGYDLATLIAKTESTAGALSRRSHASKIVGGDVRPVSHGPDLSGRLEDALRPAPGRR